MNELIYSKQPMIFGHRGYSEIAPENTKASFDLCIKNEIPGIETDVHLCKTGEIVVTHDFNLKRVSGLNQIVEETSWSTLKALDVGSFKDSQYKGQRIMLLDELLEEYKDKFYYDIELKVPKTYRGTELQEKTYAIIKNHNLVNSVVVSSFHPTGLKRFNIASHGEIPTADIFCISKSVPFFLRKGFGRHFSKSTYLKPEFTQVNSAYMKRFGNRPIISWTVNTNEEALRLFELGVSGVIGNNPVVLKQALIEFTKKKDN